MTDSDGPSLKAEPLPAMTDDQDRPSVPSFVCVLPCTNPPVKYLGGLDGCATGLHITFKDTKDLNVLYGRMADAIMGKGVGAKPSFEEANFDRCAICLTPIVPSPTSPVLYLENCAHYFHYDCLLDWQIVRSGQAVDCPHCRVPSCRALLWPQLFPTASAKSEIFQLQKHSFGIDVSPHTVLVVQKCSLVDGFPALDLVVWTGTDSKHFTVRKRPSPVVPQARDDQEVQQALKEPEASFKFSIEDSPNSFPEIELDFVQERLHKADQPRPFYLRDILPLEENVQLQAEHGIQPFLHMDELESRAMLLLQYVCPFERLDGLDEDGDEKQCMGGKYMCEFWHDWPEDTPHFIIERVKFPQFPSFFCVNNSRTCGPECEERLQVHSQELVHCSVGFHPSNQDLKDVDAFAHRMAKLIMATPVVVVSEQHLVAPFCAFCHKTAESNSVRMYLQNCDHWLHVHCVPLVGRNKSNPNHKLHCPSCLVPSVRTIAWPGSFPSDSVKQTIFGNQLEQFKLAIQDDTQLSIVEVTTGHYQLSFTVDYGRPEVVIIDVAAAQDDYSTICYD